MLQKRITTDDILICITNILQNFELKFKENGMISFNNGNTSILYRVTRDEAGHVLYKNPKESLPFKMDREELAGELVRFFLISEKWVITIIERIRTDKNNFLTGREIIELWGGYAMISEDEDGDQEIKTGHITAEGLSRLMLNMPIPEEYVEDFGSLEDYIFRDYDNNFLCGWDLT